MPRANRYFLPGYIWHSVVPAHPWATRHKNFRVQNSPLSQERIPAEVFQRPSTMDILVVWSQETLWLMCIKLCCNIESYSSSCQRYGEDCYIQKPSVDCGPNRAGVQQTKRTYGCLLRLPGYWGRIFSKSNNLRWIYLSALCCVILAHIFNKSTDIFFGSVPGTHQTTASFTDECVIAPVLFIFKKAMGCFG